MKSFSRARRIRCEQRSSKMIEDAIASVRSGAVDGGNAEAEDAKIDNELAAMVRRMIEAADEDPCAGTLNIEECDLILPPRIRFRSQNLKAASGVGLIFCDAGLFGPLLRIEIAKIYAEHFDHPAAFGLELVLELFDDRARFRGGAEIHGAIGKSGPDRDDFQNFRFVSVEKKTVMALRIRRHLSISHMPSAWQGNSLRRAGGFHGTPAGQYRENERNQHDDGDDIDRRRVAADALVNSGDHDGRGDRGESPGEQDDAVDSSHGLRAEEIGGEGRHGAEAAAIAKADDGEAKREERPIMDAGEQKKACDLNQEEKEIDARAAEIVGNPGPENAAEAVAQRDDADHSRGLQHSHADHFLSHRRSLADNHDSGGNVEEEQKEEQVKLPGGKSFANGEIVRAGRFGDSGARFPSGGAPALRGICIELRSCHDDDQVDDAERPKGGRDAVTDDFPRSE